ncbi:MAG TPA: S8 family serine peptidase, partial [Burkholderiaceae bacterium]|nr:S8 family serine peptidase [Burkholderiaceae bacterium]
MSRTYADRAAPTRLIVQGAATEDPDSREWLTVGLRDTAKTTRLYKYIGDMRDHLINHNVPWPLSAEFDLLPSYHLIELLNDDGVSRVVAMLIGRFGNPDRPGHIELIEPDYFLHLNGVQIQLGTGFDLGASGSKHKDYCQQLGIPQGGVTGAGVKIAVIDTGVEPNFSGIHGFFDLFDSKNKAPEDSVGHGTAMIKIIKDVARDAEVYAIRITDDNSVRLYDLMAGIATAVHIIDAHIINLSLGCTQIAGSCTKCGGQGSNRSTVFETYLRSIRNSGTNSGGSSDPVFVAAVGNGRHSNEFDWPARYPQTLAVGSINSNKELSEFSNAGTVKPGLKPTYVLCPGGDENAQGPTEGNADLFRAASNLKCNTFRVRCCPD